MDPRHPNYGQWVQQMVAAGQPLPAAPGYGAMTAAPQDMRRYQPWPTQQNGLLASMTPDSLRTGAAAMDPNFNPVATGPVPIMYSRQDMSGPHPWMPYTPDGTSGQMLRYPRLSVDCPTDVAANSSIIRSLQSDFPSAIVQATAAVRGSGFDPAVDPNPLNYFTVSAFFAGSGDRLIPEETIGSAFFGTGQFPRYLVGPSWKLQAGGTPLQFVITPLVNNIRIDLMFAIVEVVIGSNYGK